MKQGQLSGGGNDVVNSHREDAREVTRPSTRRAPICVGRANLTPSPRDRAGARNRRASPSPVMPEVAPF